MTEWPTRGQRAPNFWDTGLKAYVDETPAREAADPNSAFSGAIGGVVADEAAPVLLARQMPKFLDKARRNQPVTILLDGASIWSGYNVNGSFTEGVYQADPQGTGRASVSAMAAKYGLTSVTVINAGVAGVGARDLMWGGKGNAWVRSLAALVDQYAPDLVITSINSNDLTSEGATVADFRVRYTAYLREARRLGVELLMIPPFSHFGDATYGQAILAAADVMRSEGVTPVPIGATLENPSVPRTMLPGYAGSGGDTTHPNAAGAAKIATAFAASIPSLEISVGATVTTRAPLGTWDDPATAGGRFVWTTDAGARRAGTVPPVAETDGLAYSAVAAIPSTVTLRSPLAVYDMVQGVDATILYDKSGYGLNGALSAATAAPAWGSAGLTFDGGDTVRIPIDSLKRLRLTPGAATFTVRIVVKAASGGASATILGRRGDSSTGATAPFGLFLTSGSVAMWERGSTRSTGVAESTTAYDDWMFASRAGEPEVLVFRNGVFVTSLVTKTGEGASADNFNGDDKDLATPWDFVLGGRWTGTNPATATITPQFSGTVAWLEIARSHLNTTEAAAKHAALVTYLAGRSLAWAP